MAKMFDFLREVKGGKANRKGRETWGKEQGSAVERGRTIRPNENEKA